MSFRENLRRGRSHLLLVVVMIATAAFVVATEDDNLTRETGKPPPERALAVPPIPESPLESADRTLSTAEKVCSDTKNAGSECIARPR